MGFRIIKKQIAVWRAVGATAVRRLPFAVRKNHSYRNMVAVPVARFLRILGCCLGRCFCLRQRSPPETRTAPP